MDITPFVDAAKSHQWLLLCALVTYFLVATAKQGWLSVWVASKLTPTTTPWYALGVGILTTMSGDIVSGKSWQVALQDGALAAFAAILGHQFVIESLRGGREVIPEKKVQPKA